MDSWWCMNPALLTCAVCMCSWFPYWACTPSWWKAASCSNYWLWVCRISYYLKKFELPYCAFFFLLFLLLLGSLWVHFESFRCCCCHCGLVMCLCTCMVISRRWMDGGHDKHVVLWQPGICGAGADWWHVWARHTGCYRGNYRRLARTLVSFAQWHSHPRSCPIYFSAFDHLYCFLLRKYFCDTFFSYFFLFSSTWSVCFNHSLFPSAHAVVVSSCCHWFFWGSLVCLLVTSRKFDEKSSSVVKDWGVYLLVWLSCILYVSCL